MSNDKRRTTEEERLSGFFKQSEVRRLLKFLLRANPGMSLAQCRRVFSSAYQALRVGKPGAKRLYEAAKAEASWVGPASVTMQKLGDQDYRKLKKQYAGKGKHGGGL